MISQIQESIKCDCHAKYWRDNKPELLTGEYWRAQKLAKLLDDLKYHTDKWEKEKQRTASNNAWLKAQRDSLK